MRISCAIFLVGFLLTTTTGSAQVVTGAISGRITDSTAAVLPGVTVQIQNVDTNFSREIQTDSGGRYEARNLPVGSYAVTAQLSGFRTEIRRGITLTVASDVVVNMELTVGAVLEIVAVTADVPAVETRNATISGLVSQEQIRALPLQGRSYEALALLAPGMVTQPDAGRNNTQGQGIQFSSNGARQDANLFLLDGATTNDHSNQSPGSAAGLSLGVEAIREFRVLTHSYSAEYGRNAGAVVSAITRSGTNQFHGSAYEFLRNDALDARNFFNRGELPPFSQNQFGVSTGGPVLKDRVFFFANYEGFRQKQGRTLIANVPDENTRRGLVRNPATGALDQVAISPVIVPYLNMYPLPNGRNFGDGTAQFIQDASTRANEDYYMGRTDFNLSKNDTFYGRYVYDPSESVTPLPIPPFFSNATNTNHYMILSETHVFSAASLNEFRFSFNRSTPRNGTGPLDLNHALDFVPNAGLGLISFSASGQTLTNIGPQTNNPQYFPQNLIQVGDTFNHVTGAHAWKFGFNLDLYQTASISYGGARGEYTFPSLAGFLAGTPSRIEFFRIGGNSSPSNEYRQMLFGWFVQDDFRLRPNLTLNLGLRHEFLDTPREISGRTANLRNLTDAAATVGPPWVVGKLNFAPRVGLAWDPKGNGQTSIRLGGGLFHNEMLGRAWYVFSQAEYLFNETFLVRNPPNFPNALQSGFTPGALSEKGVTYHADTPTMVHYNLEVQQQATPTISVRAGYVGSHGYHLPVQQEDNIRIAQILPDGSKFFPANAPFVNPNFASIRQLHTIGISNYHALQAGVTKSFSGGLLVQSNYTWGKVLSQGDTVSSSQVGSTNAFIMDVGDIDRDYGRSAFDQRHTFSLSSRYELPFGRSMTSGIGKALVDGWEINGLVRAGSGFPVAVLTGFNNSRNGDAGIPDRPNLASGFSTDPTHGTTAGCTGVAAGQKLRTPGLWFDPCAFELPAAGTFGNLARNTVSGPGFVTVDFTGVKRFALREGTHLEFRAEVFNLLNHANFKAPFGRIFNSSGTRNGSAGVITETAGQNRQIQFGLKLTF